MSDKGVEIERNVDVGLLTWPDDEVAEYGDGTNQSYADFRNYSQEDAEAALQFEESALSRLDAAPDTENPDDVIEDEEAFEELYGLDFGVASTVLALSAAGCIPDSSCNGGGDGHLASHPVVSFWSPVALIPELLAAAEEASCGLNNTYDSKVRVYANDIRAMLAFARALIARRIGIGDA